MLIAAAVMLVILVPVVLLWVPAHAAPRGTRQPREPAWTRRDALRSLAFWTVSGPFALVLLAQVAFIVHQIAFMEPIVGRAQAALSVSLMTMMAVIGRLTLGAVVDRLDPRLDLVRLDGQPGGRTVRHDADDGHDLAAGLLRGLRLLGRQHHHAALADHPARVPAGGLRHGAGACRPRSARSRARSGPG